jgi:DNA-binding phage protein
MSSISDQATPQNSSTEIANYLNLKEIGERIAKVADSLGGKRKLAQKAHIHETQLYKYIRATNAPSLAVISAIAAAGEVSLDWLVSGVQRAGVPAQAEAFLTVPRYVGLDSARAGAWSDDLVLLDSISLNQAELQVRGLAEQRQMLFAIQLGAGCLPEPLEPGATVLIDTRRTSLEEEGLFLLKIGAARLQVKRVQVQADGSLLLLSASARYRDIPLAREARGELQVAGKVVWFCGWQP